MNEQQGNTKAIIVDVFKGLVAQGQHKKISVQNIAELSGVSRKTFYYHFADKARLIQWVYRFELAGLLEANCATEDLVSLPPGSRLNYPELPFYARTPVGIRSLDGSQFFGILGEYLQKNREYYRRVITDRPFSNFIRYVISLYQQAIISDIRFILGGRQLPQECLSQLAMYFTNAAITHYFDALLYSNRDLRGLLPEGFLNINHENMSAAIESYFSQGANKFSFLGR
ncbi:MAG: TetR/AcrR family transcriptional regulator [Coriobacteriales bacterium]|nr:TetR/AcrR family transcriptional regulator [Coriobacteriales bacterium]